MKSCIRWNLLAAAVAALSTAVVAHGQSRGQAIRMGGDSPNDPSYLTASESVQKELALTDDQKAQLKKLRDDENGGHAFFSGLIGKSQEDIQATFEKRAKETGRKLSGILTPSQLDRLNEINIQVTGVTALGFDSVAENIGLTAEQKQKLKSLGDESRRRLADLNPTNNGQTPSGLKPQERKQKQVEIAAERKSKAIALLTDEQKSKFEKLQGKKFDISTIQPNRKSFSRRGRIEAPPAKL